MDIQSVLEQITSLGKDYLLLTVSKEEEYCDVYGSELGLTFLQTNRYVTLHFIAFCKERYGLELEVTYNDHPEEDEESEESHVKVGVVQDAASDMPAKDILDKIIDDGYPANSYQNAIASNYGEDISQTTFHSYCSNDVSQEALINNCMNEVSQGDLTGGDNDVVISEKATSGYDDEESEQATGCNTERGALSSNVHAKQVTIGDEVSNGFSQNVAGSSCGVEDLNDASDMEEDKRLENEKQCATEINASGTESKNSRKLTVDFTGKSLTRCSNRIKNKGKQSLCQHSPEANACQQTESSKHIGEKSALDRKELRTSGKKSKIRSAKFSKQVGKSKDIEEEEINVLKSKQHKNRNQKGSRFVSQMKKEKLECQNCGQEFLHDKQLQQHKQKQKGCFDIKLNHIKDNHLEHADSRTLKLKSRQRNKDKSLKCFHCNFEAKTKASLRKHLSLKHKTEENSKMDNNEVVDGSGEAAIESGTFEGIQTQFIQQFCEKCNAVCSSVTELAWHAADNCSGTSEGTTPNCSVCGIEAIHKCSHMRCKECGKVLANPHSLARHTIALHSEDEPYKCKICSAKFKLKDNLIKHEKRRHADPQYACGMCGKCFTSSNYLQVHMMYHSGDRPWICEICGKTFRQKKLLVTHQLVHSGERPFQCENCDKAFRCRENLRQHQLIHTEDNIHVCDICGSKFSQPGRMAYHRKSHFNKFRWSCKYCSYVETNSEVLFDSIVKYKNHLARHHPEKQQEIETESSIRLHKCDECPKVYGKGSDLQRHKYIHQGLKPFPCTHCGKAFNDKCNLRTHLKIHDDQRFLYSYKCEICSKTFKSVMSLGRHVKKHKEKTNKDKVKEEKALNRTEEKAKDDSIIEQNLSRVPVFVPEDNAKIETSSESSITTDEIMDDPYVNVPTVGRHEVVTMAPATLMPGSYNSDMIPSSGNVDIRINSGMALQMSDLRQAPSQQECERALESILHPDIYQNTMYGTIPMGVPVSQQTYYSQN